MSDNAVVVDVTAQLSGLILSIPKRGWFPSAPVTWAPMIGWLRGRDSEATQLEGLDELMGSVQLIFNKANPLELNIVLEKLSVFSPSGNEDEEEEEHTNLICLAFRRVSFRRCHLFFLLYLFGRSYPTYTSNIIIKPCLFVCVCIELITRFAIDGHTKPEVIYCPISARSESMT
jgi:hypothetical protein